MYMCIATCAYDKTKVRKGVQASEYMSKVNALIAKINQMSAKVMVIKERIEDKNHEILLEEVMNLLSGVGNGFVDKDYYAQSRYYSRIPGVKNIRIDVDKRIVAKVTSPIGMLLPSSISIDGDVYIVVFIDSKNYSEEIDY